jgi:hypothetical protein
MICSNSFTSHIRLINLISPNIIIPDLPPFLGKRDHKKDNKDPPYK